MFSLRLNGTYFLTRWVSLCHFDKGKYLEMLMIFLFQAVFVSFLDVNVVIYVCISGII